MSESKLPSYIRGAGMVVLVLGMFFYYMTGTYGIALWAPLAILAIVLILAGSVMGKK